MRAADPLEALLPASWQPRFADAYSAWADANRRCAEALEAWRTAPDADREAAYATYLLRLDNEEAAADRLAELHAWYAESVRAGHGSQ
jgi:hypothetical protein